MSDLHVETNVAKQTEASSGSPEVRDLLRKQLQPSRWFAAQPAAGRLDKRTGRQA
jgi:hypothetical protein